MMHFLEERVLAVDVIHMGSNNKFKNSFIACRYINRAFSTIYLVLLVIVVVKHIKNQTSLLGDIAICTFCVFQAIGHFQPYWWGAKITAAIFGAINIMMIFYLFPNYEISLTPEFNDRVFSFFISTLLTVVFVFNYKCCKYLSLNKY
jgi:hypothetical protein